MLDTVKGTCWIV